MRETLNALTSFDQLKTIVVSSASQPRRDGLKTIMDELKPALRVDGFSPDYDCGIPESEKPDSMEVAWEKILVMGIALGIISPEQVDKPWVEKILKFDPASKDINIENIGIWSGDIVTRVSQDPLAVFHTTELHRLNRDLEGKTKGQRRSIIAQDKREMIELYNRVDKENPYFMLTSNFRWIISRLTVKNESFRLKFLCATRKFRKEKFANHIEKAAQLGTQPLA